MKLKKLLPIASVAGVAAVVAPIVTSCGRSWDFSYSFTMDPMTGDVNPKYTPDYNQKEGTLALKDAEADYFSALASNKNMFAKEFLYKIQNGGLFNFNRTNGDEDLTNLKVTAKFDSISINADKKTISLDGGLTIKGKMGDKSESVSYSVSMRNIIFELYKSGEDVYFDINAAQMLKETTKWSLQYSLKSSVEEQENVKVKVNNASIDEEKADACNDVGEMLGFDTEYSYYLQKVTFTD